jgi:protocatechuate 3,4-dioxygenase beta subunit
MTTDTLRRRALRRLALTTAALATGTLAAAALAQPALASSRRVLQPMTDGPFYPPRAWRESWADQDADLTRVRQRDGSVLSAQGEPLGLALQLTDRQGRAVDGAEVEIWQCDAWAAYRHPRVPAEPGRFDPGFQGFGAARSDAAGALRLRTIRPVPYPGRTPHIHVKLRHPSFGETGTQLFVDGDPGNARDFLWRALQPEDRAALALALRAAPADSGLQWQAQHVLVVPG